MNKLPLIRGYWFGLAVGLLLSGWMVMSSLVFLVNESWNHSEGRVIAALYHPPAFNNPVEYAVIFLCLFVSPVFAGLWTGQPGGKITDAIVAGSFASALIFLLTAIAGSIRMNIVLEIIRNRPAWHQALLTFAGSRSVLSQTNYYYAAQVPARLLIGVVSGMIAGAVGGLIGRLHTHNRLALGE